VTEAAGAAPDPRSPFAAGWGTAARHAALAFAVVTAVGEAAALAVYAVGRTSVSLVAFLKIGWFYVAAFHRVPIRLSGTGLDVGALTGGSVSSGYVHAGVAVAPLAVTGLALWLLWRGGRAVARTAGGGALARTLHGLKVAPIYAAPVFVLSLLVRLRGPVPIGSLVSGTLELSAAPVQALVLPLLLAAAAGAAGGLFAAEPEGPARFVRGAVAGGWWMLVLGLTLSYAGLFLAGIGRPDGPEALLTPSTGRYYQAVFDRPGTGAVLLSHHVAVAPNEAAWVLVPAMGGCTGAYPAGGDPDPFLCYTNFPFELALPAQVTSATDTAAPPPRTRFGTAPWPYFLFLLAPAAATFLGGRRAAKEGGCASVREAVFLGAAAGAVFALLVVCVSWLSSVTFSGSADFGDALDAAGRIRVGPALVGGWLVALVWGSLGGALGAVATASGSWTSGARAGRAARRSR
jgi:hypothetical protein